MKTDEEKFSIKEELKSLIDQAKQNPVNGIFTLTAYLGVLFIVVIAFSLSIIVLGSIFYDPISHSPQSSIVLIILMAVSTFFAFKVGKGIILKIGLSVGKNLTSSCHSKVEDESLMICISREIEGRMALWFDANGRGLNEKLDWIINEAKISVPEPIVKKIRFIASVRNQVVHDPESKSIPERKSLFDAANEVIDSLQSIAIKNGRYQARQINTKFKKNPFLSADNELKSTVAKFGAIAFVLILITLLSHAR